MSVQPEQVLEDELIAQLDKQGFTTVSINDEQDLLTNLKSQLEILNDIQFSEAEFKQVLNHLAKGNVLEKAKTLRDRFQINKDDGTPAYIRFLHEEADQNQYQATHQVTIKGRYKNRYDVTILINGLPLVQIELKRRGLELKEAFNQINRYQRHSYWASYGLFQYVQVFIISNGVNTKYYANNKSQSFKQTFYWADINNVRYTNLTKFAKVFLQPEQLNKLLNKYIVLNETDRILMVMRPYQIYATEAIVDKVIDRNARNDLDEGNNGYIWHTTGSGKTLTSFKTAQIITALPEVYKVVFVVDRKDLDYKTASDFNAYSKGCVDSTNNTKLLVNQFTNTPVKKAKINENRNIKLIVTTIQKLNNAISHKRYTSKMESLKDKPIVFIFDECHRSQFGKTHQRIIKFFNNHQLFGFTGTPIFVKNAYTKASRKYTTIDLFDKCLHKYTIVEAIKDENVLKFSVEYVGRYKRKDNSKNEIDIEVEGIDTKELMESDVRLEKIADYVIANHNRKSHSKTFTGIFCVNSIETLIKYYELFQSKKDAGQHNFRIATIFSYVANEEDPDADGFEMFDEPDDSNENKVADSAGQYFTHSRDKLEKFIGDYNAMFETRFSTKDSESFENYYKDISRKVRQRKIDILLVVNMFLTGFDSPPLNTLYVDKNLKFHGLIQAYSRTNRILNEQKSQGNIVCFRNLKAATDDALLLFSNKDAKETVIMPPYEEFVRLFNKAYGMLLAIAPDLDSIDQFVDEDQELEFIKAFRELMRLKNILTSFADFNFKDLKLDEQGFEDYKSKYLDLYDKVRSDRSVEKVSILEDVDFELELIQRDEINVKYILELIARLKDVDTDKEYEYQYKSIMDLLGGIPELRSKKALIEKFLSQNLEKVLSSEEVLEEFENYWETEKQAAVKTICEEENLDKSKFQMLVDDLISFNRQPLREDIFETMTDKPKILERDNAFMRINQVVTGLVDTFVIGMA